jgi:PAS domain S-box-containing protein
MLGNGSTLAFEAVFDDLDVGVIVLDSQRTIVGWNEWIARASGISKEAALAKDLLDVFPVLRDTRLPAVVDDALQVGSSSILTHTLNKLLPLRTGEGQPLLHNIVVRPASSGQSHHCLLQITDVTVSVARERILRDRQNARYHAIVDSAPDGIITTGIDRTVQWVNGACEHVFGYTAAELLGQKIDVLLEEPGSLAAQFGGTFSNNNSQVLQVAVRRKTGEPAYFGVSFGRWKADERLFITTIWRDVTERIAADAALHESESRHRALLEAVPQLVWMCASNGACEYINPQWQTYTGGGIEAHLGSGWLNAVYPEDRLGFESAWMLSLANETVFDTDARLCRADGTCRWFKLRSIPVWGADERIMRWFGTATDITDLVEARDMLRRSNDELECLVVERTREREVALKQLHEAQKMESIGQLTGGVAHDFNNLLAVILGSLSLLKKSLPDDPRTSRLIQGAIQGAERGATLTKRLLAFARRQELKVETVALQTLLSDLRDFLRQSVGPNISIVVDIPAETHPIRVDVNQFELAVINLAVNARDAMPNGGTLRITCRDEITTAQPNLPANLPRGDYVRISIADTGLGMSDETLAKATEPFFTTKGIGKGTGLGLSMVHGFIAQSGGAMEITSTEGSGTAVNLWLPRAAEDDVQSSERVVAAFSQRSGGGSRILLVDDDPLVSINTAYMLMDLGHSVMEAPSGAHALRILEADSQFDLVITDYAMPAMTGLDLAEKIREVRPHLPIVIATGYAELPPHATMGFPRLDKPYTQAQLEKALQVSSQIRASDHS